MSVYVDDMRAKFRRMVMCHMIADTEPELHEMAAKIGVARRWHQGDHYDICLSKRALAVKNGAKEITWLEAAEKCRSRRSALRELAKREGRLAAPFLGREPESRS